MLEKTTISPAQRAALFAQATRQHLQTLAKETVTQDNSTIQITLPKTRILSKVTLEVSAVVNVAGSGDIKLPFMYPYSILRRVALDANNGFSPFVVSGVDLALYNLSQLNSHTYMPQSVDKSGVCYYSTVQAGKNAEINFSLDLPVTLNDRDLIGLILLQNEQSNITVSIDVEDMNRAFGTHEGVTCSLVSLSVTPVIETFSIPNIKEAIPDFSLIKLVHSRNDNVIQGQNTVKLTCGTVYRKMFFYITDENGAAIDDTDLIGNIELVFSQSDIPYNITPLALRHRAEKQLGFKLPKGVYMFDFSNQGIPNLGGARDYINSKGLSEFWLRFNSNVKGNISTIYEHLTTLTV